MEEKSLIKMTGVSFGYKSKGRKVFEDFNLELKSGSIYGLLGKNGAGKSTILYLMSGLLRAKSGEITFNGIDVSRRTPSVLSEIFIVPEEFELPKISLEEYIKISSAFYPRFSNELLNTCLNYFEMDRNINLGELSMGQKKKAFISFALAANTSLLLMDEPTNGLDIPSKSQLRKVMASAMSEDRAIVISTHQVRDIENLLDRITIIDGGKVILNKSCMEITNRLYFAEQLASEPTDGAVYVQASVYGNSVIMQNEYGEESKLNLETLFNAMLCEKERMSEILNK